MDIMMAIHESWSYPESDWLNDYFILIGLLQAVMLSGSTVRKDVANYCDPYSDLFDIPNHLVKNGELVQGELCEQILKNRKFSHVRKFDKKSC